MKILAKPYRDDLFITKKIRCIDAVGQYADCRLIYNEDGDYRDHYCESDPLFEPAMAWMSDDWFDIYELDAELV